MSTEPSAVPDGGHAVGSELSILKADLAAAEEEIKRWESTNGWLVHDILVYAGGYLTLWLSSVPAGAGWDALIATAFPALTAFGRMLVGKEKM
jgi:hypothetical protein